MNSLNKGMFNLEYVVVLIIFVIFSTYFTFKMLEQRPLYIREVKEEIYRSQSYRFSEMIINDPGHPTDWDILVGTIDEPSIKRVGLLNHFENKTNLLSEDKIFAFETLCENSGYSMVKKLVGVEDDFYIMIIDETNTFETIECKPEEIGEIKSNIRRSVAFDSGNYGEIIVQIW